MTQEQLYLLKALKQFIHGNSCSLKDFFGDFEVFEQSAMDNHLFPMLQAVLADTLPPERALIWNKLTIQIVMRNLMLQEGAKRAVNILEKSGIDVLWLKGIHICCFYPDPQLRTMSDVDILIRPESLEQARILLKQAGYAVVQQPLQGGVVHSVAGNDGTNVELHTSIIQPNEFIHAERFLNPWGAPACNPSIGGRGLVLNDEDNFVYAVVHLAKHLEHHGVGIRYLCDIAILVEHCRDRVEWESIHNRLRDIGLLAVTQHLLEACRVYFDVALPEPWPPFSIPEGRIDAFCALLISCGVYGRSAERNQVVASIRRSSGNGAGTQYVSFMADHVFPTVKRMTEKYPYLKDHRFLLPYAWLCHIGRAIFMKDNETHEVMKEILRARKHISSEKSLFKEFGTRKLFPE